MKLIARPRGALFVLCLFLGNGAFVNASSDDTASQAAVAELTTLLHDFLANSGKAEMHARFWADDLIYTSSNGTRFGKADIMQGFDAADENDSVVPGVVYSGEDVRVQVFGNTAVVTFRLVGTPDDGSAISQYFNTGMFLKRDGEWQAIAWQATAIAAADASK